MAHDRVYGICGNKCMVDITHALQSESIAAAEGNDISFDAVASAIPVFVEGKSVQNGVPSVASPVQIESVADDGKVTVTLNELNVLHYSVNAPLRSVGEVCDEITKDNFGKWGVLRRIGSHTFTGAAEEVWAEVTEGEITRFETQLVSATGQTALCDSLVYAADLSADETFQLSDGVISVRCDSAADVTAWTTQLIASPITVLYEMTEPTWEEYDEDSQRSVNSFPSVNGENTLTTTDPLLPKMYVQYATNMYGAWLLNAVAGYIWSGALGSVTADANNNMAVGNDTDFGAGTDNLVFGANAHVASGSTMSFQMGTDSGRYNDGSRNVGIGYGTLMGKEANAGTNTANRNVAIGLSAARDFKDGSYNVNIGAYSGEQSPGGKWNVFIGGSTGKFNSAVNNTGVGNTALSKVESGENNTGIGANSLSATTTGARNTAVGANTMKSNTTGAENVAVGTYALYSNLDGIVNVAVGKDALRSNTSGSENVAIGRGALSDGVSPNANVAIGVYALQKAAVEGTRNVAIGTIAARNTIGGNNNVSVGYEALYNNVQGSFNTAIGKAALYNCTYDWCTGVGAGSEVTGSNQVQLGTTTETTYAYGAIQERSDARDKTDIKDTDLGLEFIEKLRPVKFRWDYREDYEDGQEKDGTRSGERFHEGLIAQEVKAVMDEMGVEFAGYQDHKVNGGQDVLTIGYTELISPLIKAVQELSAQVRTLEGVVNELQSK